MREGTARELVARLRATRNQDRGWGYAPGKASRLEPTCWALLALQADDDARGETKQRASILPLAPSAPPRDPSDGAQTQPPTSDTNRKDADVAAVLTSWPDNGIWLRESADTPPNVAFNGLALLALECERELEGAVASDGAARATQLRQALLAHAPAVTGPSSASRQDNSLRGWAWVEGSFSFVEPSAWCLLALKKSLAARPDSGAAQAAHAARLAEAERLLVDRMCAGGGWNYGNSNVFGSDLIAYVPTTAIGLLSLQDRRETAAVQESLRFLRARGHSEPSVLALALATICLRVFGEPVEAVRDALLTALDASSSATTTAALAAAACALTEGGTRAFTVS